MKVGMIGLGIMGKPMAKNILKAPAIMRGSICGIQQNDTDVYF